MQRAFNPGVIGGMILLGIGLFVVWHTRSALEFGTLRRMGPGLLPTLLGWLLAGLGLVIVITSLFGSERVPKADAAGAVFVLGGVVAFGVLLPLAGLMAASFVTVLIVLVPDRKFTPMAKVMTAFGVAGLTWLIFIMGLGMNLPVWPWR